MSLTLSTPLSLYSIPIVWLTGIWPNLMKVAMITRLKGYNNIYPRGNIERLGEKKVSPEAIARAARMEGAHMNGNEAFPLWATAVLAANFVGVDHYTLNVCSLLYVSLRVLYNYVYINQRTRAQAISRTLVWYAGLCVPTYLLLKAANLHRVGKV